MEKRDFYEQFGVAMTCRSYEEYVRMFDLDEASLHGKQVLDVAGGASSFTADARNRGLLAVAADPMYAQSHEDIDVHGKEEIKVSTNKLAGLQHKFSWDYYGNLEQHKAGRERSLQLFLQDYARSGAEGTYYSAMLPNLPFADNSFDMALCSHFLFLYAEQFDYSFHLESLRELVRVCKPGGEIRIYPILNFQSQEYPYMKELTEAIEAWGAKIGFAQSRLPFLPQSTHFLQVLK
jgi:SAM-dependent methyltransferase